MNHLPKDAANAAKMLDQLTALRGILRTPPIDCLLDLIDAVDAKDAADARSCYFALTAALLNTDVRRVTGDIWKDFLFAQLIEAPNRFSELAAKGVLDPPLHAAMQEDLSILQQLFSLEGEHIRKWIGTAPQQGSAPTGAPDKISNMAASAWSGGKPARKKPRDLSDFNMEQDFAQESPWAAWKYDEPGEPLAYAADEGLAILYRRFLAEDDWPALTDALFDFHAQYGTGIFLQHRIFTAGDGGLAPCGDILIPDWDELIDFDSQKERLYANTLRFLHTGAADDALLYGAGGMGKTSLVLSLVGELPQLRLVFLNARSFDAAMESIHLLQGQPHRFILFLDDLALSDIECRRLKTMLFTKEANVLMYAASTAPQLDHSIFALQLSFAMPGYGEFCAMVQNMLQKEHVRVDPRAIEEACELHQQRTDDYSVRAARLVAHQLLRAQSLQGE